MTWIASFDIGKKNFAFYIEEVNEEQLKQLKTIPKTSRYNTDGTCVDSFNKIITDVYKNGKTILHINEDLTKNCSKDKYLDTEVFYNMVEHLDKFAEYWDKCCSFVIKYGKAKKIIEFPAYYKTQVLGAPKKILDKKGKLVKMSKPERKKWAVKQASIILEERGESEVIDNIKTKSKKDDLSDVICQLQAYKFLCRDGVYSDL